MKTLLTEQQRAFNQAQVGRTLSILVAGQGREAGQMHGRSPYLQAVHFEGGARVGEIVDVRVVRAMSNSLSAERMDAKVLA